MLNKNNINNASKVIISTWLIATLVFIAGIGAIAWRFFNQQERGEPAVQKDSISTKYLSYIRSINDDGKMALAGAHEFWLNGKYLYITSVKDHGLEIMDVSDPANPKHAATLFGNEKILLNKSHSVAFYENYAYVSSAGDNAIQIINIADPKNPTSLKAIRNNKEAGPEDIPALGLKTVHSIGIYGKYLYTMGIGDNSLEVFSLIDPANPKLVASFFDDEKMSLKAPHGIVFKDYYAYILSASEGIEILDISNPIKPKRVGAVKEDDKTALSGGHDIEIAGNYIYTASYVDGLGIFDATNREKPTQIAAIYPTKDNGLSSASDLDISGKYLFIVSEVGNAMTMVDISNPANPIIKDVIKDDGSTFLWNGHFARVIGDYVYVAGLQDGFGIVKFFKE